MELLILMVMANTTNSPRVTMASASIGERKTEANSLTSLTRLICWFQKVMQQSTTPLIVRKQMCTSSERSTGTTGLPTMV